jgi:hypothetical protein
VAHAQLVMQESTKHRQDQLSARTAGQGRILQRQKKFQVRHVSTVRQPPTRLRGAQF